MNAPAFDAGTLSWVRDEIDLALERAGAALARHAASPAEPKPLAEARGHLHQACGALTLVGLAGATRFAETVEARLAALTGVHEHATVAVCAAAGAALAALRRYLDDLTTGLPDQPLRLFPAYRALLLAAGLPEPAPVELFFPDLSRRPPRRAEEPSPLAPPRLKALRLGFARGLTKWRGGEARGLAEMKNAVERVEQSLARPGERALWWVACAWLDAQPAPSDALLDELDRHFGLLVDGGRPLPIDALMAGMLHAIAVAPPGDALRESVRACYRLADLIPAAERAVVETRREACRAPLATAMAEWERFSQGAAIALMRFHDVALLLAATARDSNDAALAELAAAIADFAAWLRQQPERADPDMALEVAGALVLAEDAIEEEGARNPVDEELFAAEVHAQGERLVALHDPAVRLPPARQRWRERRLVRQVAEEMRVTLEAVEPLLDAHFRHPGAAVPPAVAAGLHQVAGACALLAEDAAARVASAAAGRLAEVRDESDRAAIAERIAALGAFAAALARGRPEPELLAPFDAAAAAEDAAGAAAAIVPPPEPASTPATGGDAELLAIFTEEARDVLAELAAAQPALAAQPGDRAALARIRRGFHTLKGSGRMVGLDALGAAALAVEHLLNHRLDAHAPADAALLDLIDAAHALFARWTTALETGQAEPDPTTLLDRCAALDPPTPSPALAGRETTDAVPPELTFPAAPDIPSVAAAGELVSILRGELSTPDGAPSRAAIDAARALAALPAEGGRADVQALADALAEALSRLALAGGAPAEAARMLLARAVGALEGMLGAIAERRTPAAETGLADALAALPAEAPAVSPFAERRQSRPADELDPQLVALFLEEADEQLLQLDADLRAWRAAPAQTDIGRRIARLLHTFKGGARMCGAMGIGELAHGMEARIEAALTDAGAAPALLDALDAALGRAGHLVAELRPASTTAAPAAPAAPAAAAQLRVRADLVDRLVNEAGEMAIARARIEGDLKGFKGGLLDLTENVARLRGQLREFEILAETRMQSRQAGAARPDFDPLELDRFTRLQELTRMMAESVEDVSTVQHALLRRLDGAGEALAAQSRHNRELAHALLRARMVPFGTVAERLHRVVRQTARELDRQASLDIRGGDAPVDRNVLERMLAPLEHLLRNAVAHGIEPPAARAAAGKPAAGQIVLDIAPADDAIVLTLADDGAGLDLEAIRRRALERGLLAEDAPSDAAALAELIFRPGFSTAATVSAVAGRGVGLDVVREEVARLGGRVAVDGNPGTGTRFEIVLPLTLAVIPVMLVMADGRPWAIPAALVEEARALDAAEAAELRAAGGVTRNRRRYPLSDLGGLYGMVASANATAAEAGGLLLLRSGGDALALAVDALKQNQEVVVKPVGDMLARVPGLAGATVLPDGAVALIVNPVALARRDGVRAFAAAVPPGLTFSAAAIAAPAVMVVDDSLTVRKITGRLLERAGYRVMAARDGADALEQLAAQRPAVILADIEMPRMDGFELVRALRADARLADIPVIMITSRIAAKHRQLALELGVRDYLGKPYDEDALLARIAELSKA
ncbi:MAG: response regulator [Pseudomonadota bacterium]